MIPTVILIALVVGKWWVVPVISVGWALLVPDAGFASAAGVAAVNALVGVSAHRLTKAALRRTAAAPPSLQA